VILTYNPTNVYCLLTKKTIGVALIAIQSTLTAVLAICIAINAIYAMCKQNPHKQKRKDAEKLRDADLTPLDAHNSLLSAAYGRDGKGHYQPTPQDQFYFNNDAAQSQGTIPLHTLEPQHQRNVSAVSIQGLMGGASPMPMSQVPLNGPVGDRHTGAFESRRVQSGHYEEYRGSRPPQDDIGVARY